MDKKFIIMISIPAIIILGFISFKMFTLTTGEDILLEIPRPIDPVDLFRGNYVNLWYNISEVNLNNSIFEIPRCGNASSRCTTS